MAEAYALVCGSHTGIPECCIRFYCNHWPDHPLYATGEYDKDSWANYVRCPECIEADRIVPIRRCTCNYPTNGHAYGWFFYMTPRGRRYVR